MDNLSKIINALALASLAFFPSSSFSQSQKLIREELHYTFRDGNRWEGVKFKKWNPVSGTLELASVVLYEPGWRQLELTDNSEQITIVFYAPAAKGISVSVFNLRERYYMDPHSKNFKSGWNLFSWSSRILNAIGIPQNNLDGVAKARLKNQQKEYFPIMFINPEKTPVKLIAEFSFTNATVTHTSIKFAATLYKGMSSQSIKVWNSVTLQPYESRSIYWHVDPNLLAKQQNLRLVAIEKNGVKHEFNIYIDIDIPPKLTFN